MEKNQKKFMDSKKATSAVVGSGAGLLSTILSSNLFAEGAPWWAPLIVAILVMFPNFIHIIAQGLQDIIETWGLYKIKIVEVQKEIDKGFEKASEIVDNFEDQAKKMSNEMKQFGDQDESAAKV